MLKKLVKITIVCLAVFVITNATLVVFTVSGPQVISYVQDQANDWLGKPAKEQAGNDEETGPKALQLIASGFPTDNGMAPPKPKDGGGWSFGGSGGW